MGDAEVTASQVVLDTGTRTLVPRIPGIESVPFLHAGNWLDPLKLRSITPDPLGGELLHHFRASVAALQPKLTTPAQQLAEYAAKRRALF